MNTLYRNLKENKYYIHFIQVLSGPEKGPLLLKTGNSLLGVGVLCDCLGSLGDSVLGQLARKKETNCSLNLTGSNGGPLVVLGEAGRFSSNPLKDVVDEGVHDVHALLGYAGVRMDLLQHLEDVSTVRFLLLWLHLLSGLPSPLLLFASLYNG